MSMGLASGADTEAGSGASGPSILVVRFSSMGDVVLTTPVLRAMRRRWPGARISFLVKTEYAGLLAGNPYLDEVLELGPGGGFSGLLELARGLSGREWTILADFHRSLRSYLVRRIVPAQARVVFPKQRFKRSLLIYCRQDLFGPKIMAMPERYGAALFRFGVELDHGPAELYPAERERRLAGEAVAGRWGGGVSFLAVAPGAAWPTKRWPAERFAEAARIIAGDSGLKVVLLGGKKDAGICGAMAGALGEDLCLNLAGTLSLMASVAVVADSRILLTNDTGLMHAATAVGTPVAAVFGPTTRHLGYFPYRAPSARVVETALWCRPCTHNGRKRCPLGHFRCMLEIKTEQVVEAARSIMAENH